MSEVLPLFDRRDGAPRLLVVEPRRAYLAVIARRLADSGYRLMQADSVQGAIAELYRAPTDIVLAELKADGFCGRELVSLIRGDTVLRDTPVMLITSRPDHGEAIGALRIGADAVIQKPFHFDVLRARIDRELERKRMIEELRASNRALDARVTERAIVIGEIRDQLKFSEANRSRLEAMIAARAA
jgi:DNA-binding response OmpR family regulator